MHRVLGTRCRRLTGADLQRVHCQKTFAENCLSEILIGALLPWNAVAGRLMFLHLLLVVLTTFKKA